MCCCASLRFRSPPSVFAPGSFAVYRLLSVTLRSQCSLSVPNSSVRHDDLNYVLSCLGGRDQALLLTLLLDMLEPPPGAAMAMGCARGAPRAGRAR